MTDVRPAIVAEINSLLAEHDLPQREFADDQLLLETGLDSLGFAILVSRLEDELGYDPFTEMEEPVYPQTLKELCEIYSARRQPQ